MPPKPTMRCAWVKQANELSQAYHDTEWGVPSFDDHYLFEFLILESAQAGLSWDTILKKREGYRQALANFEPKKVARFSESDVQKLMHNPHIVRHQAKIRSAIQHAKLFLALQKEFGSFSNYLWQFVQRQPIDGKRRALSDLPTESAVSVALSNDLRKRGFTFFGPTTAYAFLQAVGVVNDHTTDCFRYPIVRSLAKQCSPPKKK